MRFGPVIDVTREKNSTLNAQEWTALFEEKLSETQDALAMDSQARDPANFKILLTGEAGQGGVYDWCRAIRATWRGETFQKEHGTK